MFGVPVVDRHPVEPGAEITRGLVHQFAGEGPQTFQLAGIIGRYDEPKMVPVVLASISERLAVRLVSAGVEQLAFGAVAGHPVPLEISNMGA